jgi:hypothetical protein
MPPSAVYQPRRMVVTSYVSEYVDRADLVEMLDREYKFEHRGVIIYEYYIHVSLLNLCDLFRSRNRGSKYD